MSDAKEVGFSLKVMINKEKTKVLFAEVDCHFADILLSFLTLPLGRIVKVFEKHYGDGAPNIGSLNALYHSLSNLDSAHFWTWGAKNTMLNPTSSFEVEYERLKLDITYHQPSAYFFCNSYFYHHNFRSVSMYYDNAKCSSCGRDLEKKVAKKESHAASREGVFTLHTACFIISDDLHILPIEIGLLGISSFLGITDSDKADPVTVTFGFSEFAEGILHLPNPVVGLILNTPRQANSVSVESEADTSPDQLANKENPNPKKMILKVMIQKSTGKLLYAEAMEDFVEFLFSILSIPLGGGIKVINNLYRSTTDLMDDKYFKTTDMKNRLMKPKLPHGCISTHHILPLVEECLPASYYGDLSKFSSTNFPKGQGSYIEGPRTYHVTDDLIVTRFSIVTVLTSLGELQIPISDIKEVELQIGLKEALSILKASITSASVLTDGLLNHMLIKQPKPETLA